MHPLMRRMATSLMLNAACTAAPCFAHPAAARADALPPTRQGEATQQLIQLHYALAGQPGMAVMPSLRTSFLVPPAAPARAAASSDVTPP
jgi:hypothetical protein